MLKKFIFCLTTVATVSAFAASYHVQLFDNSVVNGKNLTPGEYNVELKDNSVVLKHDNDLTEVPAKTEIAAHKFARTKVRYNGKHEVQEICIGGTNKKIVLSSEPVANGGE